MPFPPVGSDGHLEAGVGVQCVEQLGDLLGWVLEVVVEGDDHLATGRFEPAQRRPELADIAQQVDAPHLGMLGAELLDGGPGGGVRGGVVDEDDLV